MSYQSNINQIVSTLGKVKIATDKNKLDQEKLEVQKQTNQIQSEKNKWILMQEKSKQKANNIMLANIKQVKDLKQQRRLLRNFYKQFQEVKKGDEEDVNKEQR